MGATGSSQAIPAISAADLPAISAGVIDRPTTVSQHQYKTVLYRRLERPLRRLPPRSNSALASRPPVMIAAPGTDLVATLAATSEADAAWLAENRLTLDVRAEATRLASVLSPVVASQVGGFALAV